MKQLRALTDLSLIMNSTFHQFFASIAPTMHLSSRCMRIGCLPITINQTFNIQVLKSGFAARQNIVATDPNLSCCSLYSVTPLRKDLIPCKSPGLWILASVHPSQPRIECLLANGWQLNFIKSSRLPIELQLPKYSCGTAQVSHLLPF